jgi:hypothetical protein
MTARRRWTEETIEATLREIVAETGTFPSRAELTKRGLGGAWTAMGRLGGVDHWRLRLGTGNEVPEEEVAVRAYLIAQERRDGDTVAHWYDARRELDRA